MTNGNDVTHNTKHTILINKTKFTPYSVPPAHAPASVSIGHTYNTIFLQKNSNPFGLRHVFYGTVK